MTHCPWCPFKGCPECAYRGGEIPAAQANRGTIGAAKTNGPGLSPETVPATPIRHNEQEDYPRW